MTRDKGASAPQRRSHHLTVENFERGNNCQEEKEMLPRDKGFAAH